eukprot:gene7010-7795_t
METTIICCLQALVIAAIVALILGAIFVKLTTNDLTPNVIRYESEKTFINKETGKNEDFPFLQESSSITLSVVVPAYNEELRLPIMLDETLEYLEKRESDDKSFSYEIIVVDDGSKDKTTEVALSYCDKYGAGKIRVLTFNKNRGKGGAVRMGVFSSRGEKILMVDADGATKFKDLDSVEKALDKFQGGKEEMAVSVGSRAHLQEDAVATRSAFRNFLMFGFHFLVYFLCVKGIKDTQCGFKLFTRKAALRLFSCLHVERWAFDVELLYIAQCLGIPIAEVPVNWQEIDGSKMVPIFSWIQMGKDLLLIRLRYIIRAWKINEDAPSLRIVSKVVGKKAKTKTDVKENSTQKLPVTPEANSSPWPYPIKLGNKVKFPLANKTSSGVVKFIGPTKFSSGLWCGIELNKPEGRNNGTVKGVKYFDCKFNYGIFIQADRVTCIDGEQEKEKKQRQNLPRFSGFNKPRSKSLDHVSLELDDKQLNPKEVADVKDVKLHDGENIGDDRFNLIDTIDEVSEVEDNMRITKEIEIDNSQMTVKIVENSNDDNNNLPLEAENDHEMIICVTGHQHLPSARPKSCSMLNSIPILNSGNVSPSLSAKDDDTDESSVTEELRRGSTLKRRLSGIEKRIRSAQLRSPGALRKAFSHGTVYPKENYVAFDENTGKLRRPLKRSQSDLTVYHRPQYTKGDAPKVPPIVSKPWLRRERTSPELVAEESKEDDIVKDDQVSVNGDVSKSNVDNALGKEVETQVDDGIGKVVAADVNDVEANVVAEMNEETVVPEVVATCDTELAVSEVLDAVVNEDFVDKKNGSNKEMKQTQSKGLSVNNGNSKSCEKEKTVLASSRKLSVPIRMQQRSLKNASTVKLSQSQNELDKRYDRNNKVDKIILNSADKVGPPSKLNKKVSDIVATFEKTKPGDSGDKKDGSIVKCSSNKISGGKTSIKITKTIVKTAARKSSGK